MNNPQSAKPTIIEFKREDASKLADLFNSFDKEGLWPGGFTGGVPYTAERVLDSFPASVKCISILISTHEDKFTGICSLHPHYEDPEAAYIGVFGAHPDYLGKGHGKALILKAIQIAAQNNLRRVDLDTWAGNLRAVPLYKKSGMFWIPETSVRMQDYIPGIKNFPLAKQFLSKYDWYSTQKRKLELVPDEIKLEEMDVFQYEFSKDGDNLKVWIDRYGRSIMGIERTMNNERLSIVARLKDHKVIAGVEENLVVSIENNTEKSIQGSVFLSGFEGLTFTKQPQQSFIVNRGESLKLRSRFVVSPEVEVPDIERKQKTIRANLIINGELVPLEVGMRVLAPLEFRTQPESIITCPGTKGTIQFNIYNNSKDAFIGKICLIDEQERLSLKEHAVPMKIPPKSYAGFNAEVEIPRDQLTSAIPLKLFAKGKIKDSGIKTKIKTIHVKCLTPGGTVSYLGETKRGKAVIIENQDVMASMCLRGALLEITYKGAPSGPKKIWTRGGFGVGPPFGFIRPVDHDYELIESPEGLQLVLFRMHQDKPGVKMIRKLIFYFGTSLIKDQIKVINTNPEVTYELNARIFGRSSITSGFSKLVLPLDVGILEHETIGFPVSESDLPTDPSKYAESWVCFEDPAQNYCFGEIWSKDKLFKLRAREGSYVPEYRLGEIKPGESVFTSAFYYVVEKGGWQTVRRRHKSLVDKRFSPKEAASIMAKPLFEVKVADPVLFDSRRSFTQLTVVNTRNKPATGKLTVIPPEGWKIQPKEIEIQKVTANKTFNTNITIAPPPDAKLGTFSGTLIFSAPNQETRFPLDFCLLSKQTQASIEVTTKEEQNKNIFNISNGLLQFKASADFAGCLYFLGKDSTLNQLGTSFPNIQTKVFLENYSGGIRSFYLDDEFNVQKSKTHEESFKAEPIEEGLWKGVQFTYKTEMQEELKGILGSIAFLTLPFSNFVKVKRRFENPTSASFKFNNCLWISPNVGGVFQENDVIFPKGDKIFHFKRAEGFAISSVEPEKGWAVVVNKNKKQSLGVVAGNTNRSTILSLDIGKTMLELFVISRVLLLPKETCEFEDFMVLGDEKYKSIDKMAILLRNQRTHT
ncbi:MAG: GNAT family N-acetyltransferase [Candidatus Bathyarchaeota archaeon]|nr:MAG: GNAT family N-acetyltransferase [Candidatus Bathyarchaeota archaeon]